MLQVTTIATVGRPIDGDRGQGIQGIQDSSEGCQGSLLAPGEGIEGCFGHVDQDTRAVAGLYGLVNFLEVDGAPRADGTVPTRARLVFDRVDTCRHTVMMRTCGTSTTD